MTDHIRVLQTIRLKGRAKAADIASSARTTVDALAPVLDELRAAGYVEEARARLKLTTSGREALDGLLAEERKEVDQAALVAAYAEFDEHNTVLKSLMTRWQLTDGGTPNDHTDTGYDAAVVEGLLALDRQFRPLLDQFVATAPRLDHYPARFTAAADRVRDGDHPWFARPTIDSYHTVWFELHEDLIGLAGLNRVDEAAAGRAG